jgi:hypothetical protein
MLIGWFEGGNCLRGKRRSPSAEDGLPIANLDSASVPRRQSDRNSLRQRV